MKQNRTKFIYNALLCVALFSQFASAYSTPATTVFASFGGVTGQVKGFGATPFVSHDAATLYNYPNQLNAIVAGTPSYAYWVRHHKLNSNIVQNTPVQCQRAVYDTQLGITRQLCNVDFEGEIEQESWCSLQGGRLATNVIKGRDWELFILPMIESTNYHNLVNFGQRVFQGVSNSSGNIGLTNNGYGGWYPSGLPGAFITAAWPAPTVYNYAINPQVGSFTQVYFNGAFMSVSEDLDEWGNGYRAAPVCEWSGKPW